VGRPEAFYRLYERRLARGLDPERLPRHIGVLVDGNRRWARAFGASTQQGHQAGAERILDFIGWCDEAGIPVVTLYMLSTENLRRPAEELAPLLEIIQTTAERLAQPAEGRAPVCVQPVGAVDLLPEPMARRLAEVAEQTKDHDGVHVNVAVGYGGRQEILDAVRELLRDEHALGHSAAEVAESVTVEQIADRLYTRGQPDPDLVIRTSGEQRLSGFLLWQSAYSEFYFCEAMWPAFRKVDFLRALRDYGSRQRRFGT
jgi:short-chain Z-isoprenyl diphosphate synthase